MVSNSKNSTHHHYTICFLCTTICSFSLLFCTLCINLLPQILCFRGSAVAITSDTHFYVQVNFSASVQMARTGAPFSSDWRVTSVISSNTLFFVLFTFFLGGGWGWGKGSGHQYGNSKSTLCNWEKLKFEKNLKQVEKN